MQIQLTHDVSVRAPDGRFEIVPSGARVNYSCFKRDGHWVHTFTCFAKDKRTILTYTEAGESGVPSWL